MAKRDDQDDDADDRAPSEEAGDDGADEREVPDAADPDADQDDGDRSADESSADESSDGESSGDESSDDESSDDEAASVPPRRALARRGESIEVGDDLGAGGGEGEGEDDHAVHQMGVQRYVISAFLVATMLGAYVLGLTIHGVWSWASNRDFFALRLPMAASVPDESKMTYGTVFGAVLAMAYAVRQYRNPEVRTWTDDVAGELAKVKWPSQKEVTNSTIVVIAASAFAMVYLFLLDRLWGFVTGLIYGAGS